MDIRKFERSVLSLGAASSLLVACGGSQFPPAVSQGAAAPLGLRHHMTFGYTGKEQTFKVPSGVTRIRVIADGANGAGIKIADGGGLSATIPVTPSETLAIFVGGNGALAGGGFNGGGAGGASGSGPNEGGYGGGGASDVRQGGDALKNRVVVAGGGGGQGGNDGHCRGSGGSGGTLTGASGKSGCGSSVIPGGGGTGGTQQQGGTGGKSHGMHGANGRSLDGGAGGSGCSTSSCGYFAGAGGGGGGGYYGGGGGGAGITDFTIGFGGGGGGGGGSSYAESTATDVQMCRGCNREQSGTIVLRW